VLPPTTPRIRPPAVRFSSLTTAFTTWLSTWREPKGRQLKLLPVAAREARYVSLLERFWERLRQQPAGPLRLREFRRASPTGLLDQRLSRTDHDNPPVRDCNVDLPAAQFLPFPTRSCCRVATAEYGDFVFGKRDASDQSLESAGGQRQISSAAQRDPLPALGALQGECGLLRPICGGVPAKPTSTEQGKASTAAKKPSLAATASNSAPTSVMAAWQSELRADWLSGPASGVR